MKVNLGTLTIASPAFEHGERIPDHHTMAGESASPALSWSGVPEGTVSFALLAHDPDAPMVGGFTHWILWDIPADVTSLEENDQRFTSAVNAMGTPGWFPPAPPPGHGDHFYYFHLFALSGTPELDPGVDADTFLAAIEDLVIEQARLVGVYSSG